MRESDWLAERFEEQRPRLRAVAQRLLGSQTEAEDAVQEAWLRLSRAGADEVDNLAAWLTTVVSRVSLNMLRSRSTRREEPLEQHDVPDEGAHPEDQALLADAIGPALLLVLDHLAPAERVAFVLHDLFAVPFEEIAPVVDRSPQATRQLASRARRRVRGQQPGRDERALGDRARRSAVVDAFLAAAREGDLTGLVRLLDPDVAMRADDAAVAMGGGRVAPELRGAATVAQRFSGGARALRRVLVDGSPGLAWTLKGRTMVVFTFTVADGLVTGIEQIGEAARIEGFTLEFLRRDADG
jgi:RNA polymerase sigma factor (sigma-70 family)